MPSPPPPGNMPDAATEIALLMSGSNGVEDSFDSVLTSSPARSSSGSGSRTNATLQARRLANRLSLGPYTRDLENFAVEDNGNQVLLLFAKILAIEQKVASIVPPSASFSVSKALLDNIKSYVLAILLSPKLSIYKGKTPALRVMAVIKHLNVNVPANIETDRHVYKTIKETVNTELTQTRSKIKKAVAASRDENDSIYELATGLVENTQCTVTVALCARLALLRKIHAEPGKSDQRYWNHLDERLELIRSLSAGDEDKVQQTFSGILAIDRQLYGTASQQAVQLQASTTWQTTVDDLMTADAAAVTNAPGGRAEDDNEDDNDA